MMKAAQEFSEDQQRLFKDWGIRFGVIQKFPESNKYLTMAMSMKDDQQVLTQKSVALLELGKIDEAFDFAQKAQTLDNMNVDANIQVCDCYYAKNEFETNLKLLMNAYDKYSNLGVRFKPFRDRWNIVQGNFNDTIGRAAGECLLKNRTKIMKSLEKNATQNLEDNAKSGWKILKELEACDVVSQRQHLTHVQHIREQCRSEQMYRIMTQSYFHNASHDIAFLERLKTDPNMLLSQMTKTTPILAELLDVTSNKITQWLTMLQVRDPMYARRYKMSPNEVVAKKYRDAHLNRVQYTTRREMFNQLDKMRELRKNNQLKKLVDFVESVMGKYYQIKTFRVMPRKIEFTNEIYNTVALAYCDTLRVPPNIYTVAPQQRLFTLLNVAADRDKTAFVKPKFGDKSTFTPPDAVDRSYLDYKKLITHLEGRITGARYPIERCYLYHEIGQQHLKQSKQDDAKMIAKKLIEESLICENSCWHILGLMLIVKAETFQRNTDKTMAALLHIQSILADMRCVEIKIFIEACMHVISLTK